MECGIDNIRVAPKCHIWGRYPPLRVTFGDEQETVILSDWLLTDESSNMFMES